MFGFLKRLKRTVKKSNALENVTPSKDNVAVVIPYTDGREYIGEVEGVIPCGYGKMVFPNGNVYEGMFRDGEPNGLMTVQMSNGDCYVGEMKGGLKCGKGKYTWSAGQVYEGEWLNDKRNGQGSFTSGSTTFTGIWEDGFLMGFGTETRKDGYRYEGDFVKSEKVKGKEILPNGDIYEGDFKSNVAHGFGKEVLHDGEVYEGSFENGQYNGHGVFTTKDGVKHEGTFVDGHLVEDLRQ